MTESKDKPEWTLLGLSLQACPPEAVARATKAHDLVARYLGEHPEMREKYLAYGAGRLSAEDGGIGYFDVLDLACAYYQAEHPITL